jgi:hypothetical protein
MNVPRRLFLWSTGWLVAVSSFAGAAQGDPKADWQEFRTEEGNFLIWVPAKPEELKVAGCPPGAHVWQASGDSLLTVFQVGFISRQEQMDRPRADAFLEGLAKETAESMKGSVARSRKITLSRWPGRESLIRFAAGEIKMCLMERIYLVADRKLFVRIVVPEERSELPDYRKILDSFKLIDEARHPLD